MANHICPDINLNKKPCYYFIENGFCSSGKWFRCIEFISRKKPIMSHSAVAQYTRCKYLFYNAWVKGWKTLKINIRKETGSLMHGYLGTHHADNDYDIERARASIKKIEAQLIDPYREDGGMYLEAQMVKYIFQGYLKACKEGKIRDFKGLSENALLAEKDNFTLKARMDIRLVKEKEIVDFKFVTDHENYTFFTTRHQAAIYLGLDKGAEKITYRCINRPKLKQGKNEDEKEFLERIRRDVYNRIGMYVKDATYYRSEYDFPKMLAHMGQMAKEISDNIDNDDFWYQASSEYCLSPFKCDFYEACTSGVWADNLYEQSSYEVTPDENIKGGE